MKSLEAALLILLMMACLSSCLKRDEANSLHKSNKTMGHWGRACRHISTQSKAKRHIETFLASFWSLASHTEIIQFIKPLNAVLLHQDSLSVKR